MKKQTKLLAFLVLIGLAIAGCSSSDDPGNEEEYNGPPLPSDAAIIDINNAEAITFKALDTFELLANTITNATFVPNGEPVDCITGSYTDTRTANISGITGQMDFYSCGFADPLTLSGIYNYSATSDLNTLTQTGAASDFSLGYNGSLYTLNVEFSASINTSTYAYSITTYFSLSGIADQGLLFTTVTPLSGTGVVESGQVVISGANNTRLRITVINNGTEVKVELDEGNGTYVLFDTITIVSSSSPAPEPAPAP